MTRDIGNKELVGQYELFALGLSDSEVKEEIEVRLIAGDPETSQAVARARGLVTALALTVPEAEPPARLKPRLMASIRQEPSGVPKLTWAWAAATALALVLALSFWQREASKTRELTGTRAELAAAKSQIAEAARDLQSATQVVDFLTKAETRVIPFRQGQTNGRILVNPASGVLLVISHLPPAPEGRAYQMWITPKSGSPLPAGVFQTKTDGSAVHLSARAIDPDLTSAIAITEESAGGSATPGSKPMIVASLAD